MKTITKVVLGTIGVVAVMVAVSMSSLAYRYFTADIKGTVDAEEQISSGGNRVQEYEKFFRLCENAQNMKGNLQTQKELLEDAETSRERANIRTNIAGINATIRKNVNQYNSMSKQYTTDRFKDSNLPARLTETGSEYCN